MMICKETEKIKLPSSSTELQKRYFVIKTIIREGGGIRTSVYGLATYMKLLGAMN
jgi:hypothetical protein